MMNDQPVTNYTDMSELALDIAAYASLLVKMGHCDCVTNQKLFVEMCNEAGFRTITGKEFSQMSFRKMFFRLPKRIKDEVRKIFEWGENAPGESLLESVYNVY